MKATVVIPVFNTEPYLTQSLESLANQTRQDFEIVVVDDGSPGEVAPIVEPFCRNGLAIKSIRHPENFGVLRARMTGIDLAEGDYVGFLDPDDSARPNFIECLLGEAERTGADIVGSRRHEKAIQTRFEIAGAEAIFHAYAEKRICNINVWTKLYRKDFIANLRRLRHLSERERFSNSEDLLLNVLCALANPTYVQIPEILVDYNEHRPDSLTNPASSEAIRRAFRNSVRVFEIINEDASHFREPVENMISGTAKFFYRKLLMQGSEDDISFSANCLIGSPMRSLVMSAMLEEAHRLRSEQMGFRERLLAERERSAALQTTLVSEREKSAGLRERLLAERERSATLRTKLASEREKSAALRESLGWTRGQLAEAWDRERRLKSILGYLWRWGVAAVTRRS